MWNQGIAVKNFCLFVVFDQHVRLADGIVCGLQLMTMQRSGIGDGSN
jgi:hypothetical protein